MTDLAALIARLEAAPIGVRSLDHAIGYAIGFGTPIEREIYEQHGDDWLKENPEWRMNPLDKRHGCYYRTSRYAREGRRARVPEEFIRVVTGPQPLKMCASFTTSIDAALTLVPEGAGLKIERYWLRRPEPAWRATIYTGGAPQPR